jgi:hypothetical protein
VRTGGSAIPTGSGSLDRSEWLWTAGLAALLFAVYAAGACRTIYVGDSGELVTAVYLLGIPHPSGYPLYVMLGKLWTLLVPAGSIAFRMSLFSAACAAAACGLLFRLGRRIGLTRTASLLAALLLAFGPSFWSQANIQRVYSLNAVFVLLATLLAWRWSRLGEDRALALAFFTCALGASNHLFMAVYAACLVLFVLVTRPSTLRSWRVMALSAAGALAGLSPYLYLPLRSRSNPRLDWGDPETLEALGTVVFRESFWERAWLESPADLLVVAWDWLWSLGPELLWAGTALALAGILWGWRRCGSFLLLPLLVMSANVISLALHGSRTDIFIWHRYYIPSYIMAALLAGLGADALLRRLHPRVRPALLLVPLALLIIGWSPSDRSRYRVADEFSRTLLGSLPPGAHLIATDDNVLFTSMYLHLVEGVRPDVNLILQGVGGIDLPPLRFDPDRDPLFFTHHPNWNVPRLEIVPVGIAFRAWRSGRPWPEPALPPERLEGELDSRVPKDHLTQNLIGQFHYMRGVTFERRDWPRAREEFDRARAAAPENDVLFYNLGLILRRNGLLDEAIEDFRRSQAINPRHLASHSRPRPSDRVAELEAAIRRVDALEAELAHDPALRGLPAGTPAYHVAMAGLLEDRGEAAAARGHMLRAVELSELREASRPGSATSERPP